MNRVLPWGCYLLLPSIGAGTLGLAWGWLLALVLLRQPSHGFSSWAWAVLAVAVQATVLAWVTRPTDVFVFAATLAAGLWIHAAWLAELRRSNEQIHNPGDEP